MRVPQTREELCEIIDLVAEHAKENLFLDKNVGKGDNWRGDSYGDLATKRADERDEFYAALSHVHIARELRNHMGFHAALREAGDELVYVAMELDKAFDAAIDLLEREDGYANNRAG